jgi:hypothetical protein
MASLLNLLLFASPALAAVLDTRQQSSMAVPEVFQTVPEFYPGPTATGSAPFLVQTDPAPWGMSYVPPSPIQTALPISGDSQNKSIFQLVGQLSHYFSGPGWNVTEYPLPPGANVTGVNVLHRHGSR